MLLDKDEARWRMVTVRDRTGDGQFYYSVRTTGVYCRPSCAARLARRENVSFHESCTDAERAGFRPCKRCKPDQPSMLETHRGKVIAVCRLIETADELPNLQSLAEWAGLSPYHFHRIFKSVVGVTPRAYADAHRVNKVRDRLRNGGPVTGAIYDSGYNSSGRFYANSTGVLGMTPTRFRADGKNTSIRFAIGECSLGSFLVAATDKGVCAILLGDDGETLLRNLQDRFSQSELIGGDTDFELTVAKVLSLIETPALGLDLPLDIRGTAFQQRVWLALQEIPSGEKVSYADVAERLGSPKSVRAVAGACAANHIAIAIPCHRVVRKDGDLSGYRWGIERKRALLQREAGG
ncbi:MAG: bifunctional DNA-binding transcriptional regulator/O6-methylguanine-DNA methyltransferase Ada [Alphaproteobacteria bacterium]|nr:bifunctional DNA-binding transcriptional regulator/O6-methylguanine-DNA methyltransferase Ada [Alphaproteobacteria bacterium]